MKFRSPTGEAIQVGLTTGHTCLIPIPTDAAPQGIEIEKRFQRAAIAAGALPEGVEAETEEEKAAPTRSEVIDQAIIKMLDSSTESDDFKGDGTPNITNLQRRVGFKLSREEVQASWARVKAGA